MKYIQTLLGVLWVVGAAAAIVIMVGSYNKAESEPNHIAQSHHVGKTYTLDSKYIDTAKANYATTQTNLANCQEEYPGMPDQCYQYAREYQYYRRQLYLNLVAAKCADDSTDQGSTKGLVVEGYACSIIISNDQRIIVSK